MPLLHDQLAEIFNIHAGAYAMTFHNIDVVGHRTLLEEMHADLLSRLRPGEAPPAWVPRCVQAIGEFAGWAQHTKAIADSDGRALRDLGDGRWLLEEGGRFETLHSPTRGFELCHEAFLASLDPSRGPVVPGDGLRPENAARNAIGTAAAKVDVLGFRRLAAAMRNCRIRDGLVRYIGSERIAV